jgi:hypothetical protein
MKNGFFNPRGCAGRRLPDPQQVIREDGVKIENRITVETDILGRADEKRNRVLVIENHLGFNRSRPGFLNDQASGIKQRRCCPQTAEFMTVNEGGSGSAA